MAIGERIHFFRLLRGMTQKYLGMSLGFPEKSADVRLAQYETGSRTPKADLTAALAEVLDVSPHALSVPDIDSYVGLMHTLFTLEDNYGLKVTEQDGELSLQVDFRKNKDAAQLHEMLWCIRRSKRAAKPRMMVHRHRVNGAAVPDVWCTAAVGMVHTAAARFHYSGIPLRLRMDSPSIWMV